MSKKCVGVISLQGAVREHMQMLEDCGVCAIPIKKPHELLKLDAFIIPGGESTTIGKLMIKYEFIDIIKQLHKEGIPIYGTCAGLILLAKKIIGGGEPLLNLMDIEVRRNAFGRQRESFEADLDIPDIGKNPFTGVFIRAPLIESVGKGVCVMSRFEDKIVMVREEKLLVTAFHPELTGDKRIHDYFIKMI
ncbi:pyridoxal 5'-phosphate synthase glutaminase subunit PdxT [Candidatus Oleimmundimicrobium sp.]|uniref:pyridoxal 5'-phosphate synthase glutaminase subunit PdxT n=1 Tax=Candidatus Oleimmundimicrobium sp. TaxID=3060597 RepID=UPI00271BAF7A|nr:pyridoxal 5'-phosphate synthase glutaminase subunit PdxT [Candidatus Oleimmundimicrobium sp.]MDO8886555.1 pyridoxal 5'-phosphate synthase glutaminase subunit PdxT [Candidatus Oleimmundimicrobium sp.]